MGNTVTPSEFASPVHAIQWNKRKEFSKWLKNNKDKCNVRIQLQRHKVRSCLHLETKESWTLLAIAISYGRLEIATDLLVALGENSVDLLDGKDSTNSHLLTPSHGNQSVTPTMGSGLEEVLVQGSSNSQNFVDVSTALAHMVTLRKTGKVPAQFLDGLIEEELKQIAAEQHHLFAPLVTDSLMQFSSLENHDNAVGVWLSQKGGQDGEKIPLPKGAVFRHAVETSNRDQRARDSLNDIERDREQCLQCGRGFEVGRAAAHVVILHPENFKGLYCLILTCTSCNTTNASKTHYWTIREACTGWTLPIEYQNRLEKIEDVLEEYEPGKVKTDVHAREIVSPHRNK
jgi:hypothetical protein